jgi:hypothetical protein
MSTFARLCSNMIVYDRFVCYTVICRVGLHNGPRPVVEDKRLILTLYINRRDRFDPVEPGAKRLKSLILTLNINGRDRLDPVKFGAKRLESSA